MGPLARPRLRDKSLIDIEPEIYAERQLYKKIAPLALAREAFILEGLDREERPFLDRILKKIGSRTEEIVARG